jgi:hypothetical protein
MIGSPLLRAVVLRLFGVLVFALVAFVAVSLLIYGVSGPQDWLVNAMQSFSAWVSAPLSEGVAMLVGIGIVLLAILLALLMVPRRPRNLRTLRKLGTGTTWVDLTSVAAALELALRARVDSTIRVDARRGRLRVVAPFAPQRPFEVVDRAGADARRQLETLGLAETVSYEITTGRETKRRVQ